MRKVWFRCFVPLLDSVIMQLEERFAPITSKAMSLLYLLPEKIASYTLADLKSKLSESLKFYQSLLPNPLLFWPELVLNKNNLEQSHPNKSRRSFAGNKSFNIPKLIYPMLKIVKTLPVSSCEAERSFSTLRRLNTWLRRLNTWLRSSMGNARLSNLARIHIHRDRAQCLTRDKIVKICVNMYPRVLEYSIVEGQILLNCSFLIIRYFFF